MVLFLIVALFAALFAWGRKIADRRAIDREWKRTQLEDRPLLEFKAEHARLQRQLDSIDERRRWDGNPEYGKERRLDIEAELKTLERRWNHDHAVEGPR